MLRHTHRLAVVALAGTLTASCRAAPPADIVAADLINEFPRVECRPAATCQVIAGEVATVRVPVPSRVVWMLPLPHGGHLQTAVAAIGSVPVRFRIGISDDRTYEPLLELLPRPGAAPAPVDIALSAYAGRQWSLFFHPDRIDWRLTLAADAMDGRPGIGEWVAPRIVTSRTGAVEYRQRRWGGPPTRSGGR